MNITFTYIRIILLSLLSFTSAMLYGQITKVTGIVTDAVSKQPLPYVTVSFNGTSIAVNTDNQGQFSLSSTIPHNQIKVSFVGYKTAVLPIIAGTDQAVKIRLNTQAKQLNEVEVTSGKKSKYRNKDNPAVELIRKVIANKKKNEPQHYNYVEYKEYDKMMFGFTNVPSTISNRKLFRNYKFLLDNRDTTTIPGKNILPIFLSEKLSQNYYRKNPEKKKQIVLGDKSVNFGGFIDSEGLGQYFKHIYYEIDIYSNNIFLITNNFLSPISDAAPTFYKYFITDTILVNNKKVVELTFTPRNTTDVLFEGKMYITLDGNYAVQRASLIIDKNININFIKSLHADLDFEQNPDGRYHLSKSSLVADFSTNKNETKGGLIGQRIITYKDYVVNQALADTTYRGDAVVTLDAAKFRPNSYWSENRLDTLTTAESKVYHNIDTLKTLPSYKRTLDIATLLFAGYKSFGPFEIGPANAFYSFNPVEGLKLRFGGRTTTELSRRYYFETYVAYGFKDERWKYFLSATYSLNNKSIYTFPQNYIRASFQRDTRIPGSALQFVEEDNVLLSFKRGTNDKYLYNDFYRVDYVTEFANHFSYSFGFKKWTQSPAGSLYFINEVNGVPNTVNDLTTTELTAELRYAPHEEFLQGKIYRYPTPSKYPVFQLDFAQGIKNVFGGQYSYQNLRFKVSKRTYLSPFGYADMIVEGGKIFGTVPYPLLFIPHANQTYAYDLYAYNLMNFLEFAGDHYEIINIDQHFNGFFFNKIPLFKKLKWRETASVKAIWGGTTDQNNPSLHPNLLQLPVDGNGQPITYQFGSMPYVEGSIGIENIFRVLRVDLIRRFNYLNHPDVPEWGIRARVDVSF